MVIALEAELQNVLYSIKFGKLEDALSNISKITQKYYDIASEGNQSIASTLKRFVGEIESIYLDIVATEYEYYVQRERAREEQRALKEQMREEAEDRKRLEQERKKVEAEEKKYKQELERLTELMQQAHDAELEKLRKRLEEVNSLMEKVETKKSDIVKLQNGKAGTVYVISNIGAFGDTVFKVGMTRREKAQERIDELNNASVPFPFDVHSTIFSEDAPALENELHKLLNDRRVNKVNLRKEFFNISAEELQRLVEKVDPTAEFHVTVAAEQYRQSLSITDVPLEFPTVDDDDDEVA
jgi:flagellar motility protein MotE (MotC chaperone)